MKDLFPTLQLHALLWTGLESYVPTMGSHGRQDQPRADPVSTAQRCKLYALGHRA